MPLNPEELLLCFIEEVQDNLETIEQGLLNLSRVVQDPESFTSLVRAAHSISGSAGMLQIPGVQHIAQHLEACLKLLQFHTGPVDARLQTQFFQGFQALKTLTAELQKTSRIPESLAQRTMRETDPVFAQLNQALTGQIPASVNRDTPVLPPVSTPLSSPPRQRPNLQPGLDQQPPLAPHPPIPNPQSSQSKRPLPPPPLPIPAPQPQLGRQPSRPPQPTWRTLGAKVRRVLSVLCRTLRRMLG